MKRLYPEKPIVGVGAIILKKGRLLLERRKNEPGKGKWSIPGGVVELGENICHAVMREVKEETALDVECDHLVDVIDSICFDEKGAVKYHFIIIDYQVTVEKGKPVASSDAAELKWVLLSEVEEYDLTDSFRLFFRKNRSRLENN